ncbi:DsbA family protein [Actinophytocola sp.]|uniref:DsbA family protein n=1 Tax=Actinophytocola sp. TaxID=1872138 RepID=UPI002ED4FE10
MGGAERNARRKRQAQMAGSGSKAVAAARRGDGDRRKVFIGVGVVVVLLIAVIGGVIIYNNQKNATEGQNIQAIAPNTSQQAADAEFTVTRDGGVVAVGESTAKVTLDVYEDFLCPACRAFEQTYGSDIAEHIADGTLQVRYHMLPMLNEKSDPPGYSMDSANAGLCAADAGVFPAYHESLFADQPEEGSRGWDDQQLAKLGTDLGVKSGDFTTCVTSGKYDDEVQANWDEVGKATYLQQEFPNGTKGFGTPTIASDQKVVDTTKSDWLQKLLASAS